MKKLLLPAVLAVASFGFAAPQSFAGCCFGLIPHTGCGCCGCKFCVRPYNAFSPVACGTVCCDGCGSGGYGGCGYGGCGPCGGGMGMCGPINFSGVPACSGPGCCGGGCCGGGCLGSLPPSEPATNASASSNPVVPPSALPTGPTSQAMNAAIIQNASYRPAYAPAAANPAPVQWRPQTMAAPSYWGN